MSKTSIPDRANSCCINRSASVFLVAALLPLLSYAVQGKLGLSLWDEGFLWYGAQRVMMGEVPLRDFQSYDIGRYYWAAGVMSLLKSKGILALRFSNALLLSLVMLVVVRLLIWRPRRPGIIETILAASCFMLWMTPDFKAADFCASIILLFALAYFVEKPGFKRYFIGGVIVGFAAVIGRNHGLYGMVGSLGAIAYLAWRRAEPKPLSASLAWTAGVFVGYLPMLILLVAIPGLADALIAGVKALFKSKSTNLTLPVPRFWWVHFDQLPWIEAMSQVLAGILFMALPCFLIACTAYLVFERRASYARPNAVFVSSVLLMGPYVHYAFSRADNVHLALGILPFLAGAITFPSATPAMSRRLLVAALLTVSVVVMIPEQPFYRLWRSGDVQIIALGDDKLKLTARSAMEIVLLSFLCNRYASDGRPFLAAPFWPGAYALTGRKSPVWEIYALKPRSDSFQQAEIARLKSADIGFAIITDYLLDGRKDLLYQVTHPALERYVRESFQVLPGTAHLPGLRVYVAGGE